MGENYIERRVWGLGSGAGADAPERGDPQKGERRRHLTRGAAVSSLLSPFSFLGREAPAPDPKPAVKAPNNPPAVGSSRQSRSD
jgi:hypothetical protein